MAESEQIPSVDLTAQVESVGQDQPEQVPEQPAAQDSEPATAVAVLDSPVTEATLESAVVAEGPEIPVAESVMAAQEQDSEPVEPVSVSDPVGVEEAQIGDSPTENKVEPTADTIPVSELESMESADPSANGEVESTETAAAVSSETTADEVPTAVVSEPMASQDVADTANPEMEQAENSQESTLGTPLMPVEENKEREAEEKRQAVESLIVPPIPVRFVFLPVQSAQNRPGYTLRGLF